MRAVATPEPAVSLIVMMFPTAYPEPGVVMVTAVTLPEPSVSTVASAAVPPPPVMSTARAEPESAKAEVVFKVSTEAIPPVS